MKVRDDETVTAEVEKTSSRILEIINLKGKVTETGAMTAPCSDYPDEEKVYRASHPWSLYNAPFEDMEKAMDRLRTELPKEGWEIVKDGVDGSRAKTPQIVADKGQEFSADIRLWDERKNGNDSSLLEVTVVSACYRGK